MTATTKLDTSCHSGRSSVATSVQLSDAGCSRSLTQTVGTVKQVRLPLLRPKHLAVSKTYLSTVHLLVCYINLISPLMHRYRICEVH